MSLYGTRIIAKRQVVYHGGHGRHGGHGGNKKKKGANAKCCVRPYKGLKHLYQMKANR